MLSQTAEHALRALLYLAQRTEDAPVPVEAIARAIGAPRNYLSKTLHALTKEGIVAGTRGPRGGFRLEVAPAELTLARIIGAFDEPRQRPVCLLGERPCNHQQPCAVHSRWRAVQEAWRAPLLHTTLADLLGAGTGGVPVAPQRRTLVVELLGRG